MLQWKKEKYWSDACKCEFMENNNGILGIILREGIDLMWEAESE